MERAFLGQFLTPKTETQPTTISPVPTSLGQPGGTTNSTDDPPTTNIMAMATAFTRTPMHLFSFQLRMTGPKSWLRSNQAWALGDAFAKQPAASSTKGVVGSSGSTTPTAPISRNSAPSKDQGLNASRKRDTRRHSGAFNG